MMLYDRRAIVAGLGGSLLLPGCTSFSGRRPSVAGPSFAGLIQHMKHDVATYMMTTARDAGGSSLCGPDAAFAIRRIKMTVTASQQSAASGSVGLTLPLNLLTIGGSGSRGRTIDNSIAVSLSLYPNEGQSLTEIPPPSPEFDGTPLTDALTQLRNDVRRNANVRPCFNFGDDPAKQDNLVKWAFTVTEKRGGGLKFSLLFFSVGAELSATTAFANTIEATFAGTGAAFQDR